jgi:hypothetical protein
MAAVLLLTMMMGMAAMAATSASLYVSWRQLVLALQDAATAAVVS